MDGGTCDGDHARVRLSLYLIFGTGLPVTTRSDTNSASSSRVFTLLISALKHLVTSRPVLLGQRRGDGGDGCQRDGVDHCRDDWHRGWPERTNCGNESAMVRLPNQRSADRFTTFSSDCLLSVSIDQLDKTDALLSPEAYIYLLGVQCLVSLSDGLAGYTFPLYNTLADQKPPAGSTKSVRAPGPLDPTTLPETEPARARLRTVRAID